jgi:hypothetical protein
MTAQPKDAYRDTCVEELLDRGVHYHADEARRAVRR